MYLRLSQGPVTDYLPKIWQRKVRMLPPASLTRLYCAQCSQGHLSKSTGLLSMVKEFTIETSLCKAGRGSVI